MLIVQYISEITFYVVASNIKRKQKQNEYQAVCQISMNYLKNIALFFLSAFDWSNNL